ncbi:MAG TPA: Gfo/Idh/MocA family oxidoreductase [Steroidobacteraceae bacterium]|jgi:predicted dehydrogenase|nr:Gfo/Idh/MocA family oxidoreductase [Steroidobacteraceae bacterium]
MSYSRRQVLTSSAALAAAPLLAGFAGEALGQASTRKLGVALCGLGSLATNQIAPALQKTRNCRLAGIVTGTPSKAIEWKKKYGIPDKNVYDYQSMHKMAANKDIDIVYVVTPNALHLEHALAAAAAGKHVFCEKPMEISVERCQQMIDAVKKAGKLLGVGYRCQFEPNHLECVRLARDKVLGEVKVIDANFGFAMGDPTQWRLKKDLAGGGCLMDVGIYCLQTGRMLTGEDPVWVSAAETRTDPVKFKEVEETIMWQAKFPSGVVMSSVNTYNANGLAGFRAATSRGWFGLEPAYFYGGNRGRRSDGPEINMPPTDQFAVELEDFADCILNNKPTKVSGEMGLSDVKYLMAIYESVKKGRPVTF